MEEWECGCSLCHRRRDVGNCWTRRRTVSAVADEADSAEDAGVAVELVRGGSVVIVAAAEAAEEEEGCKEGKAG